MCAGYWVCSRNVAAARQTSNNPKMETTSFRHAKGDINRLPCVFRKALQARWAVCECAARQDEGGRESIVCAQPLARASCGELHGLLREKSGFALGMAGPANTRRTLPAAKLMKIQCGGLNGLRDTVDPGAVAPSVHRLVRLAKEQCGELDALPFSEIVKGIAAWSPRR